MNRGDVSKTFVHSLISISPPPPLNGWLALDVAVTLSPCKGSSAPAAPLIAGEEKKKILDD